MILRQSKTRKLGRKLQRGTGDFFKERHNVVGVSLAVVGAASAVGLYYAGREKINGRLRDFGRLLRRK